MSPDDDLGHGDIEAALATRRELGARYDAELVDGFAERIERAVDRRVADQVALHGSGVRPPWPEPVPVSSRSASSRSCVGVPVTHRALVVTDNGLPGAAWSRWLGIVGGQRRPRLAVTGAAGLRRHAGPNTPREGPARVRRATRLARCEPF